MAGLTPVASAAEMRAADAALVDLWGVPAVALMEVAAHGVVDAVLRHHGEAARGGVVVACGPGNNGGDGWAVARLLAARGLPVAVWPVDPPGTVAARRMAEIASHANLPRVGGPAGAGLLVDAVLGNGVARPVEGPRADALAAMAGAAAPVVAVDLPSGLCADTGRAFGRVPTAATTVSLGAPKRGLYAGEGPERAGRVIDVDIGLGAVLRATAERLDGPPRPWPRRPARAHKRTSGSVGVFAGSAAMVGAAVLACRGALAAGAGLVTLASPGRRPAALAPEVLWTAMGTGSVADRVPDWTGARSWVVGPGLGGGAPLPRGLGDALTAAWQSVDGAMVFDADALPFATGLAGGPRIRTPHVGEAARALGVAPSQVDGDRFGAAAALAEGSGVVVLKGPFTLVASKGRTTRIHLVGGPVLATGGTGDVLAGAIGALLAAGLEAFDAASLGVWCHGRAGDLLALRRPVGVTASQVAAALPRAAREAGCG